MQAKSLFYSSLYQALVKPADFTGQVPPNWTEVVDGGSGEGGYFYDLSTMWDQYKCCLPLLLAVYPERGSRLLQVCEIDISR
jgi:putative alpha-1,2-mannosidase